MSINLRSNLTIMCGFRKSGKSEYIEELLKRGVKIKVVSFDEIALKEYDRLCLSKDEYNSIYNNCIELIKGYLLSGYNIFFDAENLNSNDRMILLRNIRKYCRENAIRCWISVMFFPKSLRACEGLMDRLEKDAVEETMIDIPEQMEGWNDILIFNEKGMSFKQVKCHTNLIV